jgi:hypothetical protein
LPPRYIAEFLCPDAMHVVVTTVLSPSNLHASSDVHVACVVHIWHLRLFLFLEFLNFDVVAVTL